jgi:ribosomal protein L40E
MGVTDLVAELGAAATNFANSCHAAKISLKLQELIVATVSKHLQAMTEFNHIHTHDGEDWICGRTMAFDDQELIRCETRDPDEAEACRRCAEQMLGYFGEPMHVH